MKIKLPSIKLPSIKWPEMPKHGEKKVSRGFLWFPRVCDGYMYWLEYAEVELTYSADGGYMRGGWGLTDVMPISVASSDDD